MSYNAIDLFAGCGGLSEGLHQAGFTTRVAVELVPVAARAYRMNHPETVMLEKDIRKVTAEEIREKLNGETLHLLAGCPPCQGFSSMRRLNRAQCVEDDRNNLILEYLRLVKELRPLAIMMENVPALKDYELFKQVFRELKELGYEPKEKVVNVRDYGVAQSRRRLVMVGRLNHSIQVAEGHEAKITVRDVIEKLELPENSTDPLHKVFSKHTPKVIERIHLTPHDGGSWRDLPQKFWLKCHLKNNIGFHDVYGRLRWDERSTTITGGCLNPSKGRFLHPVQDRVITPREAALLQSFPADYKFPTDIPITALALLIGNALPPAFTKIQAENIKRSLLKCDTET